jgi:ribose transport system substrate-binding protein
MTRPIAHLLGLAALVGLCAVLVAACGGGGGSTAGSTAAADSAGGTVGFSVPQGADPSLQLLEQGLKAEAAKGGLKVQTTDANLDLNKQISDIDTFIQQKVKVIVVWPLDSKAIQPALQRAQAAHIPLVTIYTLAGGPYFTDIIPDGVGIGRTAAEWMARKLGPGAKVAAILGPPQIDQFRQIGEGFTQEAKAAGLNLVESRVDPKLSPEGMATLTQSFKQRYGASLKGVFVTLDAGAAAAASIAGGSFKPAIVTYGGTNTGLDDVRNGRISAVVYQNSTLMGRIAGWAAGRAVANKPIPTTLNLEPPVIDSTNSQAFPSAEEQLTKAYSFTPVKRGSNYFMELFK